MPFCFKAANCCSIVCRAWFFWLEPLLEMAQARWKSPGDWLLPRKEHRCRVPWGLLSLPDAEKLSLPFDHGTQRKQHGRHFGRKGICWPRFYRLWFFFFFAGLHKTSWRRLPCREKRRHNRFVCRFPQTRNGGTWETKGQLSGGRI